MPLFEAITDFFFGHTFPLFFIGSVKQKTEPFPLVLFTLIVPPCGDPLTDPKVFGKVVFVMKDGVIYKQAIQGF